MGICLWHKLVEGTEETPVWMEQGQYMWKLLKRGFKELSFPLGDSPWSGGGQFSAACSI